MVQLIATVTPLTPAGRAAVLALSGYGIKAIHDSGQTITVLYALPSQAAVAPALAATLGTIVGIRYVVATSYGSNDQVITGKAVVKGAAPRGVAAHAVVTTVDGDVGAYVARLEESLAGLGKLFVGATPIAIGHGDVLIEFDADEETDDDLGSAVAAARRIVGVTDFRSTVGVYTFYDASPKGV